MLEHQNSLSPKKQGQFASKIRKLVNENHDIQTPKTDKVVRALDVRNEIANSKSIEQNGFIRPATAIRTRNIRVSNEAIYSNSDESSSELAADSLGFDLGDSLKAIESWALDSDESDEIPIRR